MHGYLSADIICSEKRTDNIQGQMEAMVFIILQIFFATRTVLKIGEHHSGIPQQKLGNIQSQDAIRPIAQER